MMRTIINRIPYSVLFRIIIFELSLIGSMSILFNNVKFNEFKKTDILELIISASSIIVAIIITYLFSKLFAEKTDRIQRKSEIDILSHKISAFRKIAYHIRRSHEFWQFGSDNIKSIIDTKYPNLKYEDLRNGKLSYEELQKITMDIGEISGQAYLALKGLENDEHSMSFIVSFNPKNYSVDEISRFTEYSNSFWYFLQNSSKDIVSFNNFNEYNLKFIDELYFEITSKQINKADYRNEIKNLYSYFEAEIFQKQYYLTKLNSILLPKLFLSGILNLFIFIVLLILSLICYISNFNASNEIFTTILIACFFISNTIDLLAIIIVALKEELKIQDFYKI